MTASLVFMDTETTGLDLTDDIWEFAAIRRDFENDGEVIETTHHIFIEHDREKCERLPLSFRDDHYDRFRDHRAYTRSQAASYIASVFRSGKPHVVGAVPNFDTERIARLLSAHSLTPGWHYHLIDVENLTVGFIAGRLTEARAVGTAEFVANPGYAEAIVPPWNSDNLAAILGIRIADSERHTALGDARWVMAIYDAVMRGAS